MAKFTIVDTEIFTAITLDEVKRYLKVEYTHDDEIIKETILAAVEAAENFTRSTIRRKKVKCCISSTKKVLPITPVIKIFACDGGREVDDLEVTSCGIVRSKTGIGGDVWIEYIAGYLDKELPLGLKRGILLHIARIYDGEFEYKAVEEEIMKFYKPYRKILI